MQNQQPFDVLLPDLPHDTGSEVKYRHGRMVRITFTQGVKYVADKAGAYWFIDKIATNQMLPALKAEPFQAWKLEVYDGQKGKIICTDGDDQVLFEEIVDFTGFPKPGITLWFTDDTILLPSEY